MMERGKTWRDGRKERRREEWKDRRREAGNEGSREGSALLMAHTTPVNLRCCLVCCCNRICSRALECLGDGHAKVNS